MNSVTNRIDHLAAAMAVAMLLSLVNIHASGDASRRPDQWVGLQLARISGKDACVAAEEWRTAKADFLAARKQVDRLDALLKRPRGTSTVAEYEEALGKDVGVTLVDIALEKLAKTARAGAVLAPVRDKVTFAAKARLKERTRDVSELRMKLWDGARATLGLEQLLSAEQRGEYWDAVVRNYVELSEQFDPSVCEDHADREFRRGAFFEIDWARAQLASQLAASARQDLSASVVRGLAWMTKTPKKAAACIPWISGRVALVFGFERGDAMAYEALVTRRATLKRMLEQIQEAELAMARVAAQCPAPWYERWFTAAQEEPQKSFDLAVLKQQARRLRGELTAAAKGILGVSDDAGWAEAARAYAELSKKYAPFRHSSVNKPHYRPFFAEINWAIGQVAESMAPSPVPASSLLAWQMPPNILPRPCLSVEEMPNGSASSDETAVPGPGASTDGSETASGDQVPAGDDEEEEEHIRSDDNGVNGLHVPSASGQPRRGGWRLFRGGRH